MGISKKVIGEPKNGMSLMTNSEKNFKSIIFFSGHQKHFPCPSHMPGPQHWQFPATPFPTPKSHARSPTPAVTVGQCVNQGKGQCQCHSKLPKKGAAGLESEQDNSKIVPSVHTTISSSKKVCPLLS